MTPRRSRLWFTAALVVGCAAATARGQVEVVILRDGFVVQGVPQQQTDKVLDKATGQMVSVVKSTGYRIVNEGPKTTVFSVHFEQKGAAVAPETKLRPQYKGYSQSFRLKGSGELPGGNIIKTSDFDARWVRKIHIQPPDAGLTLVEQQVVWMDPYWLMLVSPTHKWRVAYRTTEWDPKEIRKLLLTHPELAEPDGKCDPLKRLGLARFMLEAGWLQFAKDELARLTRDHPAELSNDAKEAHEKLLKDIDQLTAERYAREAELSLAAGRYQYTLDLLKNFPEKNAGAKEVARVAKVTADLKAGQERYDSGRRLLRGVIDEARGMTAVNARVAAAGGLALALWSPPKEATGQQLDLATAAERVYAELHQDSAARIETFVTMAAEAERARAAGRAPTKTPEELLAVAVSGWARGKNGATTEPDRAWKLWSARESVLAYQRGESLNERNAVLGRYKMNIKLDTDELAQIISLLPPAAPEDLDNRSGKQIPLGNLKDSGIYRRQTLPLGGFAQGLDYLVRLPPEYHHGRAYPVLVVLPSPGADGQEFLAPLIAEADRHGYILVVPERAGQFFGKAWDWKGEDHVYVTAALRDTVRHFTVDNDRVFLLGVGDGANMAMDVGLSHPDLFAGVIPICPVPKWNGMFMYYWQNGYKLPFYAVTGESAGDSITNLKRVYDGWMQAGYPAMMTVYKGRGVEWYSAETPVFFEWMARKTRAHPAATLSGVNAVVRKPWMTQRETDNHFYWLQVDEIAPANLQRANGGNIPAELSGDIRGNNDIVVTSRGVKKLTLWLSSDLIDWSKPVRVRVNGGIPPGYMPKVLQPSLDVLLEDYYDRGDRRMLFLNKIECTTIP
jgi:pimeloyl-ACP methyl ester carboxylesterase